VDAKRLTRGPVHRGRDEVGDPGGRARAAELGLGKRSHLFGRNLRELAAKAIELLLDVVGALLD
jgi:hypothetical protein